MTDFEKLKKVLEETIPEKYITFSKGFNNWTDMIRINDGDHKYRNLDIGFNADTGTFSWIEIGDLCAH